MAGRIMSSGIDPGFDGGFNLFGNTLKTILAYHCATGKLGRLYPSYCQQYNDDGFGTNPYSGAPFLNPVPDGVNKYFPQYPTPDIATIGKPYNFGPFDDKNYIPRFANPIFVRRNKPFIAPNQLVPIIEAKIFQREQSYSTSSRLLGAPLSSSSIRIPNPLIPIKRIPPFKPPLLPIKRHPILPKRMKSKPMIPNSGKFPIKPKPIKPFPGKKPLKPMKPHKKHGQRGSTSSSVSSTNQGPGPHKPRKPHRTLPGKPGVPGKPGSSKNPGKSLKSGKPGIPGKLGKPVTTNSLMSPKKPGPNKPDQSIKPGNPKKSTSPKHSVSSKNKGPRGPLSNHSGMHKKPKSG